MDYNSFRETVVSSVSERLGDSVSVCVSNVLKVNNIHLDALIIREGENNISPTIYLNSFYDRYNDGLSLDGAVDEIISLYEENCFAGPVDMDFFSDFGKVKNGIIYRLVNRKKNRELLSTVPYFDYLDLAVVFYYHFNDQKIPQGHVLVNNIQLEKWKVTCEELFEAAKKNTPRIFSYEVIDFNKMIMDRLDEEERTVFDSPASFLPIYILTNDARMNGASCVLYEKLLERIARRLGSSFYVLPSSIHEMLIVVDKDVRNKGIDFGNMVREINETVLSDDEFLSDHAYFYDRGKNELRIAG